MQTDIYEFIFNLKVIKGFLQVWFKNVKVGGGGWEGQGSIDLSGWVGG